MAGVFQAMVVRGTTPALLGTALMLFVLGLEVMEPLSQEIDQPDRTDSLPIERGELLVRHLIAPAIALVPFAVDRRGERRRRARHLAVPSLRQPSWRCRPCSAARPAAWSASSATHPIPTSSAQAFVPPEMAGMSSALARRDPHRGQRARGRHRADRAPGRPAGHLARWCRSCAAPSVRCC